MSYKLLSQKTYDLAKWIYPTVSKFPRNQNILSDRIEITTVRVLEMIIDFEEKDTMAYRKKVLNEVNKLQILLRLCKDLSFLKFRQYEYASSLLTEISDLLETGDSKPKTHDFDELAKLGRGFWKPVEMVLSFQSMVCISGYIAAEMSRVRLHRRDTILNYALHKSLHGTLLIQKFGDRLQEGETKQAKQEVCAGI